MDDGSPVKTPYLFLPLVFIRENCIEQQYVYRSTNSKDLHVAMEFALFARLNKTISLVTWYSFMRTI